MHKLFWVSCFILFYIVGKAVCQSKNSQGTLEKPKVDSDPLAAVTDVKKFVEEIIKKTSEVVLSEVTLIVCVLLSFQVHVSSSLIKLPIEKTHCRFNMKNSRDLVLGNVSVQIWRT